MPCERGKEVWKESGKILAKAAYEDYSGDNSLSWDKSPCLLLGNMRDTLQWGTRVVSLVG